ncbi:TPA: hypothetical protein DEP21_01375 [Patescibacteria group bacterium]|nr:hypothetical protein [Candidatus Gracilibacteria bacterium]
MKDFIEEHPWLSALIGIMLLCIIGSGIYFFGFYKPEVYSTIQQKDEIIAQAQKDSIYQVAIAEVKKQKSDSIIQAKDDAILIAETEKNLANDAAKSAQAKLDSMTKAIADAKAKANKKPKKTRYDISVEAGQMTAETGDTIEVAIGEKDELSLIEGKLNKKGEQAIELNGKLLWVRSYEVKDDNTFVAILGDENQKDMPLPLKHKVLIALVSLTGCYFAFFFRKRKKATA